MDKISISNYHKFQDYIEQKFIYINAIHVTLRQFYGFLVIVSELLSEFCNRNDK